MDVALPNALSAKFPELVVRLTAAFVEATGFDREIFQVYFKAYEEGEAAQGGSLWRAGGPGPVHLSISCPRIGRPKKQKLAALLTKAFQECAGPDWAPIVHIQEHPYDNIGVGGRLLSDAHEECAARKFYYDLT